MLNPGLLYLEKENKKKGIRISVFLHILLILLCFWPFMNAETETVKPIDKQYAIEITFDPRGASNSFKGKAVEGAQRPKHKEVELMGGSSVKEIPVKETPPVKQPKVQQNNTKSTSSKVESEIYDKQTDVFASNDADLETNEIPKSKSASSKKSTKVVVNSDNDEVEDVPTRKPSNNKGSGSGTGTGKATGSGTGSATSSNKDGSGTGQGNKGAGSGKDKSGNDGSSGTGTGGPGTGVFDGSGKGIFERQPISKPLISELKLDQSGRIVFKICIDRKGKSTFVDFINSGSTIKDKKAVRLAIDYVGRFVWEEDYSAAKEQCGKYTLIIENKTK
ncbi:MAG: hypothetical protein IPH57_15035 [Saprospiraceae bacterium]|nr:hypothetical protein [Saprospiraceae bacterium]